MDGDRRAGGRKGQVEPWELDLLRKVSAAFRTHDREELEAELARRLLVLKTGNLRGIRDWKAYVAKFLYNKAANWIRDTRARDRRMATLAEDPGAHIMIGHNTGCEDDVPLSVRAVYQDLDPELRRLCQVLVEESGNQVAAARRLGKHRNTIRLWVRKIEQVLQRHGF
jgi:DNA-directed RNA polymerase specialized sigma24 family protein